MRKDADNRLTSLLISKRILTQASLFYLSVTPPSKVIQTFKHDPFAKVAAVVPARTVSSQIEVRNASRLAAQQGFES